MTPCWLMMLFKLLILYYVFLSFKEKEEKKLQGLKEGKFVTLFVFLSW